MNKLIILLFFFLPFFTRAQTDVLVLKKKGWEVRSYTVGSELTMKTIYNQWFQGNITDMRNDTVYINGLAFDYKEIAAIKKTDLHFYNTVLPAGMMVAGGGIFVLGAVNGLYRGDKSKDWYTASGLATGAALVVVGYLLTKTRVKSYPIGGRFKLDYLVIGASNKK